MIHLTNSQVRVIQAACQKIYDLCDGTHSVNDIIFEVGKIRTVTQSYVSQVLNKLAEAGLIESKRGTGTNWRYKFYKQT